MENNEGKLNRNLYKEDRTSPDERSVSLSINENDKKNQDFPESGEVISGSVITDSIIQTSGGPNRIELEGNDLSFHDDTTSANGKVTGDTSRINFTHSSADKKEGFVFEKRASLYATYDNVLSIFALPPKTDKNYNYMFLGRNGRSDASGSRDANLTFLGINVNRNSSLGSPSSSDTSQQQAQKSLNGKFQVEYSQDGELNNSIMFAGLPTQSLFPSLGTGFSSYMSCGDGGISGIGSRYIDPVTKIVGTALIFYVIASSDPEEFAQIYTGGTILPNENGKLDLGSSSMKFRNIYATNFEVANFAIDNLDVTNSLTVKDLTVSDDIMPDSDESIDIGSSSTKFRNIYAEDIEVDNLEVDNNLSVKDLTVSDDIMPDDDGSIDIGSSSRKFRNFYGSVVACPLPTIPNALEVLERVPEPTTVGDRGHYGKDRLYFDDITFPKEVLHDTGDGVMDIEHTNMLGFLLKAVIELKDNLKVLEDKLK